MEEKCSLSPGNLSFISEERTVSNPRKGYGCKKDNFDKYQYC
jgi:hypothetical protein